jgi:hypothetical protein
MICHQIIHIITNLKKPTGLMDKMKPINRSSMYSGGNGSSIETAVVINTVSTSIGIAAEYEYVSSLYGQPTENWSMVQQNLIKHAGKNYDVLHIKLSDGEEKSVCFDITQFFGKP